MHLISRIFQVAEFNRQYVSRENSFDANAQVGGVCNSKEDKIRKEVKQYREYRKQKRLENEENTKKNLQRLNGVRSPVLPKKLKEEFDKQKRLKSNKGSEEISPII